jgi:phage terminase small subunit
MKEPKTPSKLTRAQLRESLDSVPVSTILGKSASRELTGKQKKFCLEVAKGATKADAYRKAYNPKSKWTMQTQPYQLSRDERIKNEIEAMQAAIKAQEYQTPAALRALVIQSLVGVITNPDAQPGQITAAAKVLGTVTEVAAFTERKEVRTITSSEDARAAIMAQLKQLSNSSAEDAHIIDAQADDLMRELAGDVTHRGATPQADDAESLAYIHTIPHEQSPSSSKQSGSHFDSDIDPENPDGETPPPSTQETPPSSFKTRPTGG